MSKSEEKRLAIQRPKTDPRVETGPTVFGNDWTGLFIRGNDCLLLRTPLQALLDGKKITAQDHSALHTLLWFLNSTDEMVKTDREEPVRYEMPKRIQ